MNEWINIKKKQPKQGQIVQTFSQILFERGDFPLGYYTYFLVKGKWPGGELFTYWKPLPEPPHD